MTSIFAILFFTLTQLIVEQQLADKYCPLKTNLKRNDSKGNGKMGIELR
jgi:hypothetical protein